MDTLTPDFDQIPDPRADDYGALAKSWLAGTYGSAWDRLKGAAYSAALAAAHGAGKVYASWERICSRGAEPAETDFLTDMNHMSAVHGAALGAVVATAFAVESFVRLGYTVTLETTRSRAKRAAGLDDMTAQRLRNFDEADSGTRFTMLRRSAKFPYSKEDEIRTLELIRYRNELAHDSPLLHLSSGEAFPVFRKHRESKQFESLAYSHRPVRLKHVISSILTHDRMVDFAINNSQSSTWAKTMRELGGPYPCISKYTPGSGWWRKTRDLSRAWEAGPERRQASEAEWYDFRAQRVRRMRLKLEPK